MLKKLMLSLVGFVAAIARAILICFPQQVLALNRSGRFDWQERILSYDPEAMRLNWISTGLRRKPGSMLAKV